MRLATSNRQAGLSLVEMLVGMMVGLIGIIIISHLYVTNEQYKRSTTGSGAAQVNGAIALYTVERDLRMAGFGINHQMALGCRCALPGCSPLQYYFNGAYGGAGGLPPLQLAPVMIAGAANLTSRITIIAAGDGERTRPTSLKSAVPNPLSVETEAGFEKDNSGKFPLIVMVNGTNCAMGQLTDVQSKALWRNPSAYNPALPGSLPLVTTDSAVFSLGSTPTWRVYSIVDNKLCVTNMLPPVAAPPACEQSLVDDVVDMQALYGVDDGSGGGTADDGIVDSYVTTTPTDGTGWMQVKAVRIAVVARSQNYERPSVAGGACDATAAGTITWADGTQNFPALEAALGAGGDAGCYKYRVFETIVPLRNMIWAT